MSPKDVSSLLKLPTAERARIASRLLSSLEDECDTDVEARWAEEIAARTDELETGAVKGTPWATVRRKLRRRTRKKLV